MTGRAVRGRKNKRLIAGQTVDTNIEEAGNSHTQQNKNDEPNNFHLALYCAYFQAYSQQEVVYHFEMLERWQCLSDSLPLKYG